MTVAIHKPWTQDEFFGWAQNQALRYEFVGNEPVAMTGGSVGHSRVIRGLHRALNSHLDGQPCEPLGPDAGVQTVGKTVRYPDALVTCSKFENGSYLVPGVVVVFEVISPSSGQTDRIIKLTEYATVPSIRRYVMVESSFAGLTVLERKQADDGWTHTALSNDDILRMPEIGIEIPVAEIYRDISFAGPESDGRHPAEPG